MSFWHSWLFVAGPRAFRPCATNLHNWLLSFVVVCDSRLEKNRGRKRRPHIDLLLAYKSTKSPEKPLMVPENGHRLQMRVITPVALATTVTGLEISRGGRCI